MREIAAHLHHAAMPGDGRTDPHVLLALAEMIDPDETKPATQVKFELRRLKRKAPPVEPNYELRRFLEDHIDVLGEPVESQWSPRPQRSSARAAASVSATSMS